MLSKSPNSIAICQLAQRAILYFPMLCEKKTCGPVTKCSIHHRNCSIIFPEKFLKEKASVSYVLSCYRMKCKMGSGFWRRHLFSF